MESGSKVTPSTINLRWVQPHRWELVHRDVQRLRCGLELQYESRHPDEQHIRCHGNRTIECCLHDWRLLNQQAGRDNYIAFNTVSQGGGGFPAGSSDLRVIPSWNTTASRQVFKPTTTKAIHLSVLRFGRTSSTWVFPSFRTPRSSMDGLPM